MEGYLIFIIPLDYLLSTRLDTSRNRDSQPNIRQREGPNWNSPSGPSPWSLGKPVKDEEEFQDSEVLRTPEVHSPQPSTKQSLQGLTETKLAVTETAWVCARPSEYKLWLVSLIFSAGKQSSGFGGERKGGQTLRGVEKGELLLGCIEIQIIIYIKKRTIHKCS